MSADEELEALNSWTRSFPISHVSSIVLQIAPLRLANSQATKAP